MGDDDRNKQGNLDSPLHSSAFLLLATPHLLSLSCRQTQHEKELRNLNSTISLWYNMQRQKAFYQTDVTQVNGAFFYSCVCLSLFLCGF